jgi:hypothetical protein
LDISCGVLRADACVVGASRVGVEEGGMSLDTELARLTELDEAVRSYLSHLWAYEQGAEHDGTFVEYWRAELERLTDDE